MAEGDLTVYQLAISDSRQGLFQSVEGAKAEAQAKLDEYWRLFDSETPEDKKSWMPMTTRVLHWEDVQHYMGGPEWSERADKRFPFGDPCPTARFGDGGNYFAIIRKVVRP